MYRLFSLQLLCALQLSCASGSPAPAPEPGRVPKVYNALITSNQNLEPSKAYPLYQPVLHDPFAYPYQPVFYGDYPISNNLNPSALLPPQQPQQPRQPQQPQQPQQPPQPSSPPADEPAPPQPAESPGDPKPQGSSDDNVPPALPPQPSTKSPIPLNQFGLPSQVLPLGRFNPAYNGFTQVTYPTYSGFPYPYPGFRFYDPYDPFSLNPYANLQPLYRPLYSQGPQGGAGGGGPDQQPPQAPASSADSQPGPSSPSNDENGGSTPPPEPSDLNALNYPSKDPSIPNVPPPPLPSGGIRDDKSE